MAGLLIPVPYTGMSSWQAHIDRYEPSSEPGTDFYCPPGTPVLAPADGEIWGYGESVIPATGRWVGVNFANGMSFRCMHHAELRKRTGRVFQGDVLALSGSSGYGSEYFGEPYRNSAFWANTGGDHTHVTLWPTWDHRYGYRSYRDPYTVDFMQYVDASLASGGSSAFPIAQQGEDMYIIRAEGRTPTLVGPGMAEPLNDEEAANLGAIVSKDTIVNARQFDLAVSAATRNRGLAAQVWGSLVDRGLDPAGNPVRVSALQELADAKTMAMQMLGKPTGEVNVDVDEVALAASLAPLITGNLSKLSDDDVQRLAKASADEQDRRERERLG